MRIWGRFPASRRHRSLDVQPRHSRRVEWISACDSIFSRGLTPIPRISCPTKISPLEWLVFAMAIDRISVRGARQHNLKNINVDIPRDRFTVITGLSGSGKSSLAFDTIYAEGQRRYVESLSAYARQFLDQLEK